MRSEMVQRLLQESVVPLLQPSQTSCGGSTCWRHVACLNMSDPSQQHPSVWQEITTPHRMCRRTSISTWLCCSLYVTSSQPAVFACSVERCVARSFGYLYGILWKKKKVCSNKTRSTMSYRLSTIVWRVISLSMWDSIMGQKNILWHRAVDIVEWDHLTNQLIIVIVYISDWVSAGTPTLWTSCLKTPLTVNSTALYLLNFEMC